MVVNETAPYPGFGERLIQTSLSRANEVRICPIKRICRHYSRIVVSWNPKALEGNFPVIFVGTTEEVTKAPTYFDGAVTIKADIILEVKSWGYLV
jgi:hypothetical protein